MTRQRLILLVVLLAALATFIAPDLGRYLGVDDFKSQQAAIENWRAAQPLTAAVLPLAAANKYVPGVWRNARAPQALLAWAGRVHAWRRG